MWTQANKQATLPNGFVSLFSTSTQRTTAAPVIWVIGSEVGKSRKSRLYLLVWRTSPASFSFACICACACVMWSPLFGLRFYIEDSCCSLNGGGGAVL
jgi:hypothetical protein